MPGKSYAEQMAGPQPDGTEGIATIVLLACKDNKETKIALKACIVKSTDVFLRDLLQDKQKNTKYFVCMPYYKAELPSEHDLVKAEVNIYRFRKKFCHKHCKRMVILKDEVDKEIIKCDNHCFLPCKGKKFNNSSFLEKYSKTIIRPSQINLCGKTYFAVKRQQGRPEVFSFNLKKTGAGGYSTDISSEDLDSLEFLSSLYAGPDNDVKKANVIGFYKYKKKDRQMSISTFGSEGMTVVVAIHTNSVPPEEEAIVISPSTGTSTNEVPQAVNTNPTNSTTTSTSTNEVPQAVNTKTTTSTTINEVTPAVSTNPTTSTTTSTSTNEVPQAVNTNTITSTSTNEVPTAVNTNLTTSRLSNEVSTVVQLLSLDNEVSDSPTNHSTLFSDTNGHTISSPQQNESLISDDNSPISLPQHDEGDGPPPNTGRPQYESTQNSSSSQTPTTTNHPPEDGNTAATVQHLSGFERFSGSIQQESNDENFKEKLRELLLKTGEQLKQEINKEARVKSTPMTVLNRLLGTPDTRVRGHLTQELRRLGLTDSIKWMKRNLLAGVTGPLLDENLPVSQIGYTTRKEITVELCVNDKWKRLAESLGFDNSKINFLNERYTNPAEQLLLDWQTKRNSTVGDLYNILVKLEMPVIADVL